jgi:apolipoprotein N-acyltransferase
MWLINMVNPHGQFCRYTGEEMMPRKVFTFETRSSRYLLLLLGVLLLFLTRERWAVHLLGWIAPVPFLVFLKTFKGRRSELLFLGMFCLGFIAGAAKIFTPPWPRMMILAFGIPIGVIHGAGYLIWNRLRRGIPSWLGNLVFAASMVTMEWALYSFTPFGSTSAAAYTQLDNLPMLQTVSLFGICGLSFLLYWFAAVTAEGLTERRIPLRQACLAVGIIAVAHIWGTFRIGSPVKTPTATVATVQTDFDWFATPVLPSSEQRRKVMDTLFERSAQAAAKGAQMVVWNELSNIIDPQDEPDLIKRGQAFSRSHRAHLVMSYLTMLSMEPMKWENKYVWLNPEGEVTDIYLKHKPAGPVEPAVPGKGVPKVVETGFGKAAGAICFDFDFPQIGLALARNGVDFVFVPGADTLSIDPYHTQIAAVRAIEGGYSAVRSARHGLSAGFGPYGRARGLLSANESNEKILIVTVPAASVPTLYKLVGDIVPWLSAAFLLFLIGRRFWRRVQRKPLTEI